MKISELRANSISPIIILDKQDNAALFGVHSPKESTVSTKLFGELNGNIRSIGELTIRLGKKRIEVNRMLNRLVMQGVVCRVQIGKTLYFVLVEDFKKLEKII